MAVDLFISNFSAKDVRVRASELALLDVSLLCL